MSNPEAIPERVLGRYLEPQSPPLLPELRLWLVSGQVDLNARCQELLEEGRAPYWAFCWGAGQALARHVLDHPERVRGRHVVDFGAGSGVVGIAAALAGASRVSAVDSDDTARRMLGHNARLNGVALDVSPGLPEDWDALLAADVLYEPALASWLLELSHSHPRRRVLVADPERPGNARLGVAPLYRLDARCFPDVDAPTCNAAVFEL
jgi:predicted nicotinamide N-methyase